MPRDQIEEQMNIDLSRLQRQTLERYFHACIDAGEVDVAEELRAAMSRQDDIQPMDLAA